MSRVPFGGLVSVNPADTDKINRDADAVRTKRAKTATAAAVTAANAAVVAAQSAYDGAIDAFATSGSQSDSLIALDALHTLQARQKDLVAAKVAAGEPV